MGSHGNSLLCPKCKTGILLPKNCEDFQADWCCTECKTLVEWAKVDTLLSYLWNEQKNSIEDSTKRNIQSIEKLIKKFSTKLDERNLLSVRLKYNLLGLYGRQSGYTSQEMTEKLWRRKKDLCEDILNTLKVLEPQLTTRKARIMYELHLPLLMLAQHK